MSEFLSFVVAGVLLVQAVDAGRPDLTEARIQGLRAKNIFSPFRTKPFPTKTSVGPGKGPEAPRIEAPARPKPPVLTGIVYDEASKAFQAIVEDRNGEKLRQLTGPKVLKAGDEVLGVKIEAVEKDKVVILRGETRKELAAGEALWEAEASSSGAAAPVESKPADPAVVNSVLEELRKRNKKKDRNYDEP